MLNEGRVLKGESMTLSYNETKTLIDLVLKTEQAAARDALHLRLKQMKRTEPEFYAGVRDHGPGLLTPDQLVDLLNRFPNRLLYADPKLMNKLSEKQREELPQATFGSATPMIDKILKRDK
jgi:hypothetical protein